MATSTKEIAEYFDGEACDYCESYKKQGLSSSSKILMSYLVERGVADKTLLDVGCGTGAFSIEALKNGAASCVGVDLSPVMVETANELAVASGFRDRAKFAVGDIAADEQASSDIVVMDKVVCCYPDVDRLLENASRACKGILVLTVPRDEGVVKAMVRLWTFIDDIVEKLRGRRLHWYLHSLKKMDRTLRESGFVRTKKQGSWFWLVLLYERGRPSATVSGI